MSYPILYAQDATDFFSLGLGPMHNALEAYVHEERNSVFYLELKMLTDKMVKESQIIRADAGHLLKDQRFVIKKITDNHDGTSEIYAEHVSYLTQELTLKPETFISGGNGQFAMNTWLNAILEPNPFSVYSDVPTTASTHWRIDKVNNPRRALGGVDGSILDNWGGEYRFDNYQISLLAKRGTTAQTVLAYGRNITGFEVVTDIESVYTSIYPYAVYRNEGTETLITIDGLVVDVENIANYPNRRTLPVDFGDKFDSDTAPTKERLIELAQQYIVANNVGVPKVSIKVNFLDLSQTADYADYRGLETVNLCDDVKVIYPSLGVNTIAKVIRVKWNVLTDSYDEIEIGEKRLTLGTQLNNKIEDLKEEVNNQFNYSQLSADGKNTIFYGLYGENGLGQPTANKIGDMWYKPNGEETEFYIRDGTEWRFIFSTRGITEVTEKIEDLEQELEDTKDKAQQGLDKAEQAINAADFSANQAETAINIANGAVLSAEDAKQSAFTAYNTAISALNTANGANTSVNNLAITVNDLTAEIDLKVTKVEVNSIDQRVTTNATNIGVNANALTFKANQTDVNLLSDRLTTTETNMSIQSDRIGLVATETTALTNQLGNLSNGGRNYAREDNFQLNSTTIDGIEYWIVSGDNQPNQGTNISYLASRFEPNTQYTVQFIGVVGQYFNKGFFRYTDGSYSEKAFANGVRDWFTSDYGKTIEYFTIDTGGGSAVGYIQKKTFQLEKGNIVSDWQPAPEVNDIKVSQLQANLTVEANKINGLVTKTDGMSTTLGQLQLSDEALTTLIGQVQNGLNDKVSVDAFSSLQQTLSGFQTTVQNTYADKNTVTQLATLWQQTTDLANGHTGQISNLGDQINLRVTKDEFKKVSGRNLAIDCPRTLKLTGDSSYQVTHNNYFRLPKSLQGEKVTISLTITRHGNASFGNVGVYLDGSYQNIFATILNNIGPDETKRFTRTLTISAAHELSGYVQINGGNLNGSITLSDFKIEYGEVATDYSQAPENDVNNKTLITQINLSEDGILIQGKKIMIDGETYITNGVIKDAMIDSLTATKITTGTLNAANVNIINLNASKLVADRIDGLSLYGSYIEGGEIRGNTLIYLNDGTNNTVLSAANGVSTTRGIASRQQIRSEDWIYAGRTIDGTTTELGGFHGWRVMSNFLDPLQTNGTLAIGQRSTIDAKAVHYLDSTFKRYANVDMALRIGTVAEQPPTAGMYTLWCGSAYAGTGLYVTAPNGQTRSIAIF